MGPTIRVDDEVMDAIKNQAVEFGLVFGTPNAVLRRALGLEDARPSITRVTVDDEKTPSHGSVDIEIGSIHYARTYNLIPVPRDRRSFFPGYKVPFELATTAGVMLPHVTSAPKGTAIGHPTAGTYIQGGLKDWYATEPALDDGATLRIEALEPGKRYRMSVVRHSR